MGPDSLWGWSFEHRRGLVGFGYGLGLSKPGAFKVLASLLQTVYQTANQRASRVSEFWDGSQFQGL